MSSRKRLAKRKARSSLAKIAKEYANDDDGGDVKSNVLLVKGEADSTFSPDEGEPRLAHKKKKRRKRVSTKSTTRAKRPFSAKREAPKDWEEVWREISMMRAANPAPVDSMGCERLADANDSPETFRYQTLISLMLSSQTKDEVTAEAMANLREHGLTVDNIMNTSEKDIDELIKKVGFHNRKASYIKRTTKMLVEQYDGDIPRDLDGLVSLVGVGPKMAYLTLQCAWGDTTQGIGVDVHVHRISNRLGWVESNTPEQTRMQLQSWMPVDKWAPVNALLVGFGQTICRPIGPKCSQCTASHMCPSSRVIGDVEDVVASSTHRSAVSKRSLKARRRRKRSIASLPSKDEDEETAAEDPQISPKRERKRRGSTTTSKIKVEPL